MKIGTLLILLLGAGLLIGCSQAADPAVPATQEQTAAIPPTVAGPTYSVDSGWTNCQMMTQIPTLQDDPDYGLNGQDNSKLTAFSSGDWTRLTRETKEQTTGFDVCSNDLIDPTPYWSLLKIQALITPHGNVPREYHITLYTDAKKLRIPVADTVNTLTPRQDYPFLAYIPIKSDQVDQISKFELTVVPVSGDEGNTTNGTISPAGNSGVPSLPSTQTANNTTQVQTPPAAPVPVQTIHPSPTPNIIQLKYWSHSLPPRTDNAAETEEDDTSDSGTFTGNISPVGSGESESSNSTANETGEYPGAFNQASGIDVSTPSGNAIQAGYNIPNCVMMQEYNIWLGDPSFVEIFNDTGYGLRHPYLATLEGFSPGQYLSLVRQSREEQEFIDTCAGVSPPTPYWEWMTVKAKVLALNVQPATFNTTLYVNANSAIIPTVQTTNTLTTPGYYIYTAYFPIRTDEIQDIDSMKLDFIQALPEVQVQEAVPPLLSTQTPASSSASPYAGQTLPVSLENESGESADVLLPGMNVSSGPIVGVHTPATAQSGSYSNCTMTNMLPDLLKNPDYGLHGLQNPTLSGFSEGEVLKLVRQYNEKPAFIDECSDVAETPYWTWLGVSSIITPHGYSPRTYNITLYAHYQSLTVPVASSQETLNPNQAYPYQAWIPIRSDQVDEISGFEINVTPGTVVVDNVIPDIILSQSQ